MNWFKNWLQNRRIKRLLTLELTLTAMEAGLEAELSALKDITKKTDHFDLYQINRIPEIHRQLAEVRVNLNYLRKSPILDKVASND